MDREPTDELENCEQLIARVNRAVQYLSEQRADPKCSAAVRAQAHSQLRLLVTLRADLEETCKEDI
jgi:hypothetical protein